MEICIIGAGYVGLTTTAVLAEFGHTVYCIEVNEKKINDLKRGKVPIYEPQLEELLQKNKEKISFTTDIGESINKCSVIFVTVGTPSREDGSTDLTYLYSAFDEISLWLTEFKTIIIKSTVPPGTNKSMSEYLAEKGISVSLFNIVSNPEFLKEGSAIYDMFHPDKTVIGLGNDDKVSEAILRKIYHRLDAPFIVTNWNGAEMIKYASNAFLATKISFINEIARVCEEYDADVMEVANGLGTDPRIGALFLQAGIGYGGSCFPKDLQSLNYSASVKSVHTPILEAVQLINRTQIDSYIKKLGEHLSLLKGKKITVLGVAFKPLTDDIRHSPAIDLITRLHTLGVDVHVFDPKAHLPLDKRHFATQHKTLKSSYLDSEAIVIATDWPEFRRMDWKHVKASLKGILILDGRNCVDKNVVEQHGLVYKGVGRR
ncbi:UDPglucose 6-dehydrogenase [Bacillus tianshenii]|uniref:UDP-glucose 6-dehydrogenase n=1 Tax=Sutcliffiella tianshenii TaxID=1463404 RepID=A0ABS2P5P2_9BACI|nr:UDP-glucose/GDP-mannose dehydrogenase family protein [Bacillus tianshenii]MBM7622028.1 UDPglucose 6-dehydrogenase [Bacillus tianshenii]